MNIKLPFGLKERKLVHISEVERGIECNCICPACHHPLVAKKGEKTAHHFAHYKGKECEYGLETSIHLAAKEVLEKHKKIVIPEVSFDLNGNGDWTMSPKKELSFDTVKLETFQNGVIPDVLVYIQGKPLMIEITVTHKTGEEKIQKVREQNISILEINLEKIDRTITFEQLENEVIFNDSNKIWLLNNKTEKLLEFLYQISESKDCTRTGKAICPKHFASGYFYRDCINCKFLVSYKIGKRYNEYLKGKEKHYYFFCSGKSNVSNIKELIEYSKINETPL